MTVFINQSSGYLMVDIVNAYAETGCQCVIVSGLMVERNHPLNNQVKRQKIIRYNNKTPLKRIFTWGLGTIQILWFIWFKYRKAHLFIVSNPPFAPLLPLALRNSFSLLIFDVYPDALTELGFLKKSSPIIRLWKKANCIVFGRAKNIFTITEGMKEALKPYAGERPVTVVPIWTDNEFLKPLPVEKNPFITKHNLTGKFVVLYSGNIGVSNEVEVLADVAKTINRDDIVIVIIGSGAHKKRLENKVKKEGIRNCLILPWQDASQLPFTLSAANLAVVTLGKGASKLAIPSKLYSLLSVGAPILGITDQSSDLHQLIERHDIGCCFAPENKEGIVTYIEHLANNTEHCKRLSTNALKASQLYTIKNVAKFLNPKSLVEVTESTNLV
ncbi:MAG: glycosyltransferase family 4 protein [Bacteroidia bacterium]|nr:glycosyltransferase family 4 protein [Bacteroidia bacterium]